MKKIKIIGPLFLVALFAGIIAGSQISSAAENDEENAKFFPTRIPRAVNGKNIYDQKCLKCHGVTVMDDGPAAAALSKNRLVLPI